MTNQSVPELISKNVGNYLSNYKTWADILVNVKAYGAKGDGVTDDTAPIQAAINAAFTAGGGVVYIPPTSVSYVTTLPLQLKLGVSFVGGVQQDTVFLKNHSGDFLQYVGDVSAPYNQVIISGFKITVSASYTRTGIGLSLKNLPRIRVENITIQETDTGIKNDYCLVSVFENIGIDRCNTGVNQTNTSNLNVFIGCKIIGISGSIGFTQNNGYATKIISTHIEYCNYPIVITGGNGYHFDSCYFESNTHGCKLAGGRNFIFESCFNSTVELIDSATFAGSYVFVNGLQDDYPKGIGTVNFAGHYNGNSFGHITNGFLVENGNEYVPTLFASSYLMGLFSGSLYDFTGPGIRNLINSQDMSNSSQWSGSTGATKNTGAGLGGKDTFTLAAGASLLHSYNPGIGALAGKTMTQQILVKGAPGTKFRLTFSDNVTGQVTKDFEIGAQKWTLIHLTQTWSSGSTGGTYAIYFNNTGTSSVDVMLPMLTVSSIPVPPIDRPQVYDLSGYEKVRYINLGSYVEVYGTAAPTTGQWRQGDRNIRTAPAASGYIGDVCVTSGAPGTWKGYGAVQA